MKIGIWIDIAHFAKGGPSAVIIGFLIGLKQLDPSFFILINETGDLNFQFFGMDRHPLLFPKNTIHGPNPIYPQDITVKNPDDDLCWKYCKNMTFSAKWMIEWLSQKFPIQQAIRERRKNVYRWEAGVDTEFFTPAGEKTQDFFIYHKSTPQEGLSQIWDLLFHNYYGIRGELMMYHFYDANMLRSIARRSKFCIVFDEGETQGLYALEILACDCPIFCIDKTTFTLNQVQMLCGVTSIVSWDDSCGIKVPEKNWKEQFPKFLENLETYKPRQFVEKNHTFKEASRHLLKIALDSLESAQSLIQT
jgi:hypothetical protein